MHLKHQAFQVLQLPLVSAGTGQGSAKGITNIKATFLNLVISSAERAFTQSLPAIFHRQYIVQLDQHCSSPFLRREQVLEELFQSET